MQFRHNEKQTRYEHLELVPFLGHHQYHCYSPTRKEMCQLPQGLFLSFPLPKKGQEPLVENWTENNP